MQNKQRDSILRANRDCYQQMKAAGAALCQFADAEDLRDPLAKVDALGWLGGNIRDQRVLCLAGGGGRQSCLYAAAGGKVTVVDLSPAMLDLDRQAARELGFEMELIEASMDDLSMLHGRNFDLVIHPVSSCYLPCVTTIYEQVAQVMRDGGLYISQHKTPTSLQSSTQRDGDSYRLQSPYYTSQPIPPRTNDAVAKRLREPGAVEFVHRWEELIGGLCRSGFVIEDLVEPMHAEAAAAKNSFADRANYIAPYVRIKARRTKPSSPDSSPSLWVPENR